MLCHCAVFHSYIMFESFDGSNESLHVYFIRLNAVFCPRVNRDAIFDGGDFAVQRSWNFMLESRE